MWNALKHQPLNWFAGLIYSKLLTCQYKLKRSRQAFFFFQPPLQNRTFTYLRSHSRFSFSIFLFCAFASDLTKFVLDFCCVHLKHTKTFNFEFLSRHSIVVCTACWSRFQVSMCHQFIYIGLKAFVVFMYSAFKNVYRPLAPNLEEKKKNFCFSKKIL